MKGITGWSEQHDVEEREQERRLGIEGVQKTTSKMGSPRERDWEVELD